MINESLSKKILKNNHKSHNVLNYTNGNGPQYGILGNTINNIVNDDQDKAFCISLFGKPGGGISYEFEISN